MSGVSALIPTNNNNNTHHPHARHNAMNGGNGPNGRQPQEEYVRRVGAASAGGAGTAPFPRARTLPTRFPQGKEFKQTTPFVTRHASALFLHQ
mmetsp:Transcript_19952/g.39496  ORF Transcript_19952/g.39496 Transcript_19952/m.39496 type:complete len:93 (+) Transcript_19952:2-280(+)